MVVKSWLIIDLFALLININAKKCAKNNKLQFYNLVYVCVFLLIPKNWVEFPLLLLCQIILSCAWPKETQTEFAFCWTYFCSPYHTVSSIQLENLNEIKHGGVSLQRRTRSLEKTKRSLVCSSSVLFVREIYSPEDCSCSALGSTVEVVFDKLKWHSSLSNPPVQVQTTSFLKLFYFR